MPTSKRSIFIIGAGPVGCFLSLLCAKLPNCEIHVYEKQPLSNQSNEGRNVNITLSRRGLRVLSKVGLVEKIEVLSQKLEYFQIHPQKPVHYGEGLEQEKECYLYSLKRNDLRNLFLEEAKKQGVVFHFQHEVLDFDGKQLIILDCSQKEMDWKVIVARPDLIVGADGVNSVVKKFFFSSHVSVQAEEDAFEKEWPPKRYKMENSIQERHWLGYREFVIPPNEHELRLDTFHIWKSKNKTIVLGLPNKDKSITIGLYTNMIRLLMFRNEPQKLFDDFPDDLQKMILKHSWKDSGAIREGWLSSTYCRKYGNDNIVLIGDACHSMLPFLGIGLNCSLEDCQVLADELKTSFHEAPSVYSERRILWGHFLVKLSRMEAEKIISTDVTLTKTVGKLKLRVPSVFEKLNFLCSTLDELKNDPSVDDLWSSNVYVDLEERVEEGELLATCSAMKTVSHIYAPVSGVVKRITKDSQGKPIFEIK